MCGFLKDYSCRGGSITIFERVRNCHFIFRLFKKKLVDKSRKCGIKRRRKKNRKSQQTLIIQNTSCDMIQNSFGVAI